MRLPWPPKSAQARRVLAWAPLGAVSVAAVVRALLAQPPEPVTLPLDEAQQRDAFKFVASDESVERRDGAKTFPTDLWSRDDDFHQHELKRAHDWAHTHHASIADTLEAVDRGLRERWPQSNPSPLVATTPPCRPRAIY
jgi:hypothetical protein